MASPLVGELSRYGQQQVGQAVHFLPMNFSSGVAGSGLAFNLDLNSFLACKKVETPGSRIVDELHVPSLLHEVGRNADLICKRPGAIRAIDGVAQAAREGSLHVGSAS